MTNNLLQEFSNDLNTGHSEYQMDFFITKNASVTLYSQYMQTVKELYNRINVIQELSLEIQEKKITLKVHTADFNNSTRLRLYEDMERASIKIKRAKLGIEGLHRQYGVVANEIKRFYQQASVLKAQLNPLTEEQVSIYEEEMWEHKAKFYAAKDILTSGKISSATFDMISSMSKKFSHNLLHNPDGHINTKAIIDWYNKLEPAYLPQLDTSMKFEPEVLSLLHINETLINKDA